MSLIKSISGIRGTIGGSVGDNLTPLDIVKFTSAYAKWLYDACPDKKLTVVIGRDARISGPFVEGIIENTLIGCGIDVINVGLCTTPGVELAVMTKAADGGIIITASHNPRQWNAMKLLNKDGEFLNAEDGAKVLRFAENEDFIFRDIDNIGHLLERTSFDKEHIDMVLNLPLVNKELIKSKRYKVVVDAVNSVGGIVIPQLLEQLGVEVIRLNCEPTGDFAHNPEPLPENLIQIRDAVIANKADLGIVVDPDVDRLALVCENGEMFGEEYTLVAVSEYVLSKKPGNTVSNLSSSRALRDVTKAMGGSYAASAVGEVNVVAKMKETNAIIGGEGNGGVIYPELHYGRDALVGIALFLTHLAEKNIPMTELKNSYPHYFISKNKIELSPEINVDKILSEMFTKYSHEEITDIDGVKIDLAEDWVHLRKSNTEPIIRIYTESKNEETALVLAKRIGAEINSIINC